MLKHTLVRLQKSVVIKPKNIELWAYNGSSIGSSILNISIENEMYGMQFIVIGSNSR